MGLGAATCPLAAMRCIAMMMPCLWACGACACMRMHVRMHHMRVVPHGVTGAR